MHGRLNRLLSELTHLLSGEITSQRVDKWLLSCIHVRFDAALIMPHHRRVIVTLMIMGHDCLRYGRLCTSIVQPAQRNLPLFLLDFNG